VGTLILLRSSVKSVSENALMQKYAAGEASHHPLQPERLANPFRSFGSRAVVTVERHAEILPELRAVGENPGPYLVEHFHRRLAAVLSISGGTAPISTALATRLVPWRPM
jgi:hypothetical protein